MKQTNRQQRKMRENYYRKKLEKTQLKESTIRGLGLFATENIKKMKSCVSIQENELKFKEIEQKRHTEKGIKGAYFFRLDDEFLIDATVIGVNPRYINHNCAPNVGVFDQEIEGNKSTT